MFLEINNMHPSIAQRKLKYFESLLCSIYHTPKTIIIVIPAIRQMIYVCCFIPIPLFFSFQLSIQLFFFFSFVVYLISPSYLFLFTMASIMIYVWLTAVRSCVSASVCVWFVFFSSSSSEKKIKYFFECLLLIFIVDLFDVLLSVCRSFVVCLRFLSRKCLFLCSSSDNNMAACTYLLENRRVFCLNHVMYWIFGHKN